MNTPMNKRRLETMERIEQALVELLQTCSMKEISVTDICRRANINRSTFYANYDDVAALAAAFCRNLEKRTADLAQPAGNYVWLFEHVAANPMTFRAYFSLEIPPIAGDYQTLFRRNGVYGIVKRWFDGGCIESAKEMDRLLDRIIK